MRSPNTTARLLSFNAPANISLALAVPLFTLQGLRRHQFLSTKSFNNPGNSKVPDFQKTIQQSHKWDGCKGKNGKH